MSLRPAAHLVVAVDGLAAARGFYIGALGLPEGRSTDHRINRDLQGHQGNALEFTSFSDEAMVFAR